ncbi:hypothetical protein DU500_12425 [Haloplanus rubicundus]|uniref:Uncharacterized protein n=2 Tax=Haloplanus rubicundus TaxID=1547898 RepID=A0A345E4P2_9EURY|nr:hypothetical protein DU500_12425 [Haloplanus rubicundus]
MSHSSKYRCITCMDETVTREFDVSHLSRTCGVCGEFDRFVNTVVVERFNELDADPPPHLHWEQLDRPRKFLIAERLSRRDHTIDDFEVAGDDDQSEQTGKSEANAEV